MPNQSFLLTFSYLVGNFFLTPSCAAPLQETRVELGSAVAASELVVNTSEQHYSLRKSREAGEQDLYRRCLDSVLEETWVYVKRHDGQESWDEAGEKETRENAVLSLTRNHLSSPETIAELFLYHFHPEMMVGKGFTSETTSSIDILGATKAAYFVKGVSPELLSRLDFKLVVSSGVYTLSMDLKALEDSSILNETRDALHSLDGERLKIALGMSDFDYSPSNRVNFPKLNQEFARRYSRGAVKLEFRPK